MSKKILKIFLIILSIISLFSCGKKKEEIHVNEGDKQNVDLFDFDKNYNGKKIGVIYFSVTGNTKEVAEKIASIFDVKTTAIEPVTPYTDKDLDIEDKNSRCNLENDFDIFEYKQKKENGEHEETTKLGVGDDVSSSRKVTEPPKIKKINVKSYDIIFLGYPIWFTQAPKVMYTFIDNKDLIGKKIVPFCTSDNDDIGISDQNLMNYSPEGVYFMSGKRFTKDVTVEELKDWIKSLGADINLK